jgi:hypothetical protein
MGRFQKPLPVNPSPANPFDNSFPPPPSSPHERALCCTRGQRPCGLLCDARFGLPGLAPSGARSQRKPRSRCWSREQRLASCGPAPAPLKAFTAGSTPREIPANRNHIANPHSNS